MKSFTMYDKQNAKSPANEMLAAVESSIGFVPNVFAAIAESPVSLKAFIELNTQFNESSFDATSHQIIQLAVSVENQCTYCVAGHTAFSEMQKVPVDIVNAMRNNQPLEDSKLEALNQFTRTLVNSKGPIPEKETKKFLDAGYTHNHVIEVILGICVKTFSNLTNNIIGLELDEPFRPYAWNPENQKAA